MKWMKIDKERQFSRRQEKTHMNDLDKLRLRKY